MGCFGGASCLVKTYPECWHFIMAAEDRCRGGHGVFTDGAGKRCMAKETRRKEFQDPFGQGERKRLKERLAAKQWRWWWC